MSMLGLRASMMEVLSLMIFQPLLLSYLTPRVMERSATGNDMGKKRKRG
jgi:hypothetical protein